MPTTDIRYSAADLAKLHADAYTLRHVNNLTWDQVATALDEPVAVVRRHPRERRELLRGDRPTEQPDPCQCTVGGSMRGEHSGTTIGGRARRRRPRPISGDISSGTTGYGATRRGVGVGHTIQGRCRAGARTAR